MINEETLFSLLIADLCQVKVLPGLQMEPTISTRLYRENLVEKRQPLFDSGRYKRDKNTGGHLCAICVPTPGLLLCRALGLSNMKTVKNAKYKDLIIFTLLVCLPKVHKPFIFFIDNSMKETPQKCV